MNNTKSCTKSCLLLMLLFLVSGSVWAEENFVYLMLKAKLKDTTYSEVVFLYEEDVQTLEKCTAEVERGKQGKWRYYQHLLNANLGVSFDAVYQCISTPVLIEYWNHSARYRHIYFVDLRNTPIKIIPRDTYSNCLTDLRSQVERETDKLFCAKSSQGFE